MSKLKIWYYSFNDEDFESGYAQRTIKIVPSNHPDYNWECNFEGGIFRFKTKKSARKNLGRIYG